jgi:hypothetical protein
MLHGGGSYYGSDGPRTLHTDILPEYKRRVLGEIDGELGVSESIFDSLNSYTPQDFLDDEEFDPVSYARRFAIFQEAPAQIAALKQARALFDAETFAGMTEDQIQDRTETILSDIKHHEMTNKTIAQFVTRLFNKTFLSMCNGAKPLPRRVSTYRDDYAIMRLLCLMLNDKSVDNTINLQGWSSLQMKDGATAPGAYFPTGTADVEFAICGVDGLKRVATYEVLNGMAGLVRNVLTGMEINWCRNCTGEHGCDDTLMDKCPFKRAGEDQVNAYAKKHRRMTDSLELDPELDDDDDIM